MLVGVWPRASGATKIEAARSRMQRALHRRRQGWISLQVVSKALRLLWPADLVFLKVVVAWAEFNHAALGTSLAGTRPALTTTRLGPSQFLVGRLPQRLGCLTWPWRRPLPPGFEFRLLFEGGPVEERAGVAGSRPMS